MDYSKIEKFISPSRINSYLICLSNDREKSQITYRTNIKISQSFYPLLSTLEVSLRNAINAYLMTRIGHNWIMNCDRNELSHRSLRNNLISYIRTAKGSLSRNREPINHESILSSLPFVFWNTLFNRTHYSILKTKHNDPLDFVFPDLPEDIEQQDIYNKLKRIRRFRNRVYHYEPVCFASHRTSRKYLSESYAEDIYENIYEILNWLDNDLVAWVKEIDNTNEGIEELKKIISEK